MSEKIVAEGVGHASTCPSVANRTSPGATRLIAVNDTILEASGGEGSESRRAAKRHGLRWYRRRPVGRWAFAAMRNLRSTAWGA